MLEADICDGGDETFDTNVGCRHTDQPPEHLHRTSLSRSNERHAKAISATKL